MRYELIKVSEIHPSPDNIRKRIGGLKQLKESIEAVGLLQPIVVSENDEGFVIVAGHRRFAAVEQLGWDEVDVVVRDFADAEKIQAMIIENFHREDLTPLEQADGLFQLEGLGLTRKEIAAETGLSQKLVRERIKLLDLPKTGRDAIEKGQLSIEAGLELAKEASDVDLVEEAIGALLDPHSHLHNVDMALRAAKEEQKREELAVQLEAKVEKLKELGREVRTAELKDTDYYGQQMESKPSAWPEVVDPKEESWRYHGAVKVDPKAHAKEECAIWFYTPAHGHRKPSLEHLCRKPSRHTFTGDSDLKVPDAKKEHTEKEQAKEERRRERYAKAAAKARYQAALDGKKPKKSLMFEIASRGFTDETWAENRKEAAQLLGIEPREREHGTGKDWDGPFWEFALDNPEKAILALYLAIEDPLNPAAHRYRVRDVWEGLHESIAELIPEELDDED